jgi:hypothetical protein
MLKYTQLLTEIQFSNMWKTMFLMLDFVIHHHAKKNVWWHCKWRRVYLSSQGLSKQHVHCPSPCCYHIKGGVRLTYFITADYEGYLKQKYKCTSSKETALPLFRWWNKARITEKLCATTLGRWRLPDGLRYIQFHLHLW